MKKNFALLSLVALGIAACGSSDDQAATASEGDEFCRLSQVAKDDNDALDTVDVTDADAVRLQLSTAIDSLTAMAAKAPKDIIDTVNELLDNEETLEGLLQDNDYNFVKFAASDEGKTMIEDDSISEVGDEVDAYISDKCGIDVTEETTAVDDTIAVDNTVIPDITVPTGDTIFDLGEGEEAINQFLDFYELGTAASLTDDERTCIVSNLVDKVTGADLNQAISGQPTEEVQLALGQAFIDCDVAVES